MKRALLVLGLMTLGVGPLARSADPAAIPNCRFSYGKIEWVDKCVTCKRLEWREERLERPVTRCTWEVRPVQRVVMEPTPVDSVRLHVDIIKVPRVECCDVQKCRLVPVMMYDHLKCCCFMSVRPEYFTVQVKKCVIDTKVITREIPIKVCKMCPQVRTVNEKFMVPCTETVCEIRRFPVYVPYQTTMRVPVCMPSPVPVPPGYLPPPPPPSPAYPPPPSPSPALPSPPPY